MLFDVKHELFIIHMLNHKFSRKNQVNHCKNNIIISQVIYLNLIDNIKHCKECQAYLSLFIQKSQGSIKQISHPY